MNGKNFMPNIDKIVNDKIDHKSIIDEIKTNAVVKVKAVNLLKEIRLLSGINYRKYKALKYNKNSAYIEFNYINVMIDDFADKNKLKGFKK
jgi:hypothetical protein